MDSLEAIYTEICEGYSELASGYRLKHLSFAEQAALQKHYTQALAWGTQNGLKTEQEILRDKQAAGLWSAAKSIHIKSLEEKLAGLERSKPKVKSLAQIDAIWDSLCSLREQLQRCLEEKYTLLAGCAEMHADSKLRFFTLLCSLMKNGEKAFKSEEDLDSLSDAEYDLLEKSYFSKLSALKIENIKKICIEPFFWLPFGLVKEPAGFFQTPVHKLTIYQINMLRLGQTFAKIASEVPDLDKEYEGCPERMLMFWYYLQNRGQEKEAEQENTSSKFLHLANSLKR